MTAPRTKRLLRMGALVVIVAGVVATVLLWRSGSESAEPRGPMPLGNHQVCSDTIMVYVQKDEDMTRVAGALAGDTQIAKVVTETSQEVDDRYRRVFANQPELRDLLKPGRLGAVIHVVPSSGTRTRELADRLRTQVTEASRVEPIVRDEPVAGITVPPLPCPSSGEFPR
ncbi:hypothetical protein JOF56_005402 [Kibdelosporangium banguiense]|uniref:FtsX extracellular domain-containing protein n=1 Tax=Kibdelosporangium banguiense TaxID=1365924 RepID=A0ABS4TKS9_9PSEU|nr:hypothetical protein [Kibdelosporangium banguiense]MBP2325017.1 hypothetical protein [Kibdelosporangium banguiense]